MSPNPNIVHIIVNNLGGISSLVQNLVIYKSDMGLPQELILLDIEGNMNSAAFVDPRIEDCTSNFSIDPKENWYHTYGRLAKSLSKRSGLLVSNDQFDLIMLEAFNIPRKVVQLVHDPYNLELFIKFHECIDAFVTHSRHIKDLLELHLSHRSSDIFYIPYGIPLTLDFEKKQNLHEPLKLIFLGRHDKAKGVYDLYTINQLLKEKRIDVSWTILGTGPESANLKEQWKNEPNVKFKTPATTQDVLEEASLNDILVLPTKFEGFPVALLEAMSMGCVPVITDLPGGINEVVHNHNTGFKCQIDDNASFATAIQDLHANRELLHQMQLASKNLVRTNFDVKEQAKKYQEQFNEVLQNNSLPMHHSVNKKIGSRLDHQLIPAFVTRIIRRRTV